MSNRLSTLKGTGVALITPFTDDMMVDYKAIDRLLDHVTRGGVDYVVFNGTTGESPTITSKEKWKLMDYIFRRVRLPVVLGYGGNCTAELVDELDQLSNYPLTAILSVTPYYNKPSQEGLYQHYQAIADHSPFPVILYNVPFRTSINLEAETTLGLAKHENICGIKEASGDLRQIQNILTNRPANFLVLSGDDGITLDILKLGGDGVISVIANYKPSPFTHMVKQALIGKFEVAEILNEKLSRDYQLIIQEGNPSSVKTALEAIGIANRRVRLPLVSGSDELLELFRERQ